MPAFCTPPGRRTFVDSATLLTGYDPVMQCGGVDQLPVGHVHLYHSDVHAVYLRHCQQHDQLRGGAAAQGTRRLHQAVASADAIRNENYNDKERNSTTVAAEMLHSGSASNAKALKYGLHCIIYCRTFAVYVGA